MSPCEYKGEGICPICHPEEGGEVMKEAILRRVYKMGTRTEGWMLTKLRFIKKGELFKMHEPDSDELVKDGAGRTKFVASADAFEVDGLWRVDVDDESEEVRLQEEPLKPETKPIDIHKG